MTGPLTEHLTRHYTRQVLEGLQYLHQMKIIHRDIEGMSHIRGGPYITCNMRCPSREASAQENASLKMLMFNLRNFLDFTRYSKGNTLSGGAE